MSGKPTVFLLVEDDEDDVFFMQRAFKEAGLKNPLHVVSNGEEAIDYFAGHREFADREKYPLPDMVLLDLKMPGLNGFEVLAWLRQQTRFNFPVAVLTSSSEELDFRRARELGASCYLLKPPTPTMLRTCCQQFHLSS